MNATKPSTAETRMADEDKTMAATAAHLISAPSCPRQKLHAATARQGTVQNTRSTTMKRQASMNSGSNRPSSAPTPTTRPKTRHTHAAKRLASRSTSFIVKSLDRSTI